MLSQSEIDKQRIEHLEYVLTQILKDLPAKRDWLDPLLERQAFELLKGK
jgi:hypothetical protein